MRLPSVPLRRPDDTRPAVLIGLLVLLFVTGCTADGTQPSQTLTSSPLAPYLDALLGPSDPETKLAQAVQYEDLLATCMKENGFDYVPRPWTIEDVSGRESSGDPRDPGVPSAETISLEGYGILAGEARMYVDPNGDLIAAMSEQEGQEYGWARYGQQTNPYLEDDPRSATWVSDGCETSSRQATTGTLQALDTSSLVEGILALQQEALADDRLAGLYQSWADCMTESGYAGFEYPLDAPQSITDGLSAIQGASDSTLRQDLARSEIELATADLACRTSSGYQERTDQLWWSYEQAFVDEYRGELDSLTR